MLYTRENNFSKFENSWFCLGLRLLLFTRILPPLPTYTVESEFPHLAFLLYSLITSQWFKRGLTMFVLPIPVWSLFLRFLSFFSPMRRSWICRLQLCARLVDGATELGLYFSVQTCVCLSRNDQLHFLACSVDFFGLEVAGCNPPRRGASVSRDINRV